MVVKVDLKCLKMKLEITITKDKYSLALLLHHLPVSEYILMVSKPSEHHFSINL